MKWFKQKLYQFAHQTQLSLMLFLAGLGLFYSGIALFYYSAELIGVWHSLSYLAALALVAFGFVVALFAYFALTYYRWFNLFNKPSRPVSKDKNTDHE
ncbi:hypothetical protein HF888_05010 [Bermanella marisrubri]|uniref:Uncharacterized protein n=1 Tax=Bermanella marisrubri TaxID=207949 RepID=Q1N1Y8_9GAMM|nr:hypothetical protein [Bermanella marisrubri]EAT12143.1 hypothetical protein RED65_03935 [Oceanobacter sp. RED65] [Bermanella marisrubri]QIZ83620.1 hypothetical protein HF888_05010 [Bermanella marisrubri]